MDDNAIFAQVSYSETSKCQEPTTRFTLTQEGLKEVKGRSPLTGVWQAS